MRYTIQKFKAKKGAFFIDLLSVLKDYSSVISAVVALTNLFFVGAVFKFNRRMSQSKLSLFPLVINKKPIPMSKSLPEQERIKADKDHNQLISNLRTTYFLKEYSNIKSHPGLPVMESPINFFEQEYILGVKLKNNGDLPSTNVHVKLLFKMYGSKNVYPKDSIGIDTFIDRELFADEEINIRIPYIGANEEIVYKIFEPKGQFRETELILLSIKANGFTYIKNSVFKNFFYPNSTIMLNHYKHSILRFMEIDHLKTQGAITAKDMEKFYGLSNKK